MCSSSIQISSVWRHVTSWSEKLVFSTPFKLSPKYLDVVFWRFKNKLKRLQSWITRLVASSTLIKKGINVRITFSIQHLIKKLVSSQTFMKTENESEESTSKVDDTICLSLCLKTHEGTRKKYMMTFYKQKVTSHYHPLVLFTFICKWAHIIEHTTDKHQ